MKSYFKRAIMFCSAVGLSLSMFAVSALANGGTSTYGIIDGSSDTSVVLESGSLYYSTYNGIGAKFVLKNKNVNGQRIYIYASVTNGKLIDDKTLKTISSPVGGTGSGSVYVEGVRAPFTFRAYNTNVAGYRVTSYSAVN